MKRIQSMGLPLVLPTLLLAGPGAKARIEVRSPVDITGFAQAQQNSAVIIVESFADRCLACRIRAPMLAKLRQEPEYRAIRLFRIGENTPKAIWKRFRLKAYGVLILYRGSAEIGRLTGAKSEAELRSFIDRADHPVNPNPPKS